MQTNVSWTENGNINTDSKENIVTGISKIGDFHFVCGVTYDAKGVCVQFISAVTKNVLFFEWDSFSSVELVDFVRDGESQNSAIFQLQNLDVNIILPWDQRYDFAFEHEEG